MNEKRTLAAVQAMTFDDFLGLFSPRARRDDFKIKCLATIFGMIHVIPSVEGFMFSGLDDSDNFDAAWAITKHAKALDDTLANGFPLKLEGEKRAEFLITLQFFESGKLRSIGIESWGLKAIITRTQHNNQTDMVHVKEFLHRS
jgi:hypothetical protein